MKKKILKIIIGIVVCCLLGILIVAGINKEVNQNKDNICDLENTHKQVALVLGARVWANGQMSDIFRDRVETAVDLYENGKVDKILVSGDHGRVDYDEVNSAKDYLLEKNIPKEDIFLDHAGFDTYDSLYRARDIFEAESLIIVTQDFHLPRSLYLADNLGLDACGISADIRSYYGEKARNRREVLAKVKAWLNIKFNSKPKYLGEKIPLSGSGLDTWD